MRRFTVPWCVVGAASLIAAGCSSSTAPRRHTAATARSTTTATAPPVSNTRFEPTTAPNAASDDVARFRDVTAGAGLSYVQGARRTAPNCLLGTDRLAREFPKRPRVTASSWVKGQCIAERMTGGVAVGDYDNDGWPDLYVTRFEGPGILYRNQGNGTFTDVTAASGLDVLREASSGAAWADIDNDGYQDLYVTTMGGHRYYFFHNDGHDHFVEQAKRRGLSQDDGTVHVGFSVNVGDYDGDGYVDIATSEWRNLELAPNLQPSHSRLFHNRGARQPGYFDDVTDRAGVALETRSFGVVAFATSFSDLDGDGREDFVSVNDFITGRLYWNNGDGTFTNGTRAAHFGTEENGMGLTVADYDGDGRPDIFVSSVFDPVPCPYGQCIHGSSGNRLYRNLGGRKFADVTGRAGVRQGGWGWGAAFLDAANSGLVDLVMTSGVDTPWEQTSLQYRRGPTYFFRNLGTGSFAPVAAKVTGLTAAGPGKGLALLDYDRDGRLDLIIVRDGATPVLYHNVTATHHAWLGVRLVGTRSNRDGVGAIVEVRRDVGGRVQRVEYGSVSHFLGQSEATAHFGLGTLQGRVAELHVRWPSGAVSTLHDIAPNAFVTVVEPRT